MLVDYIWRPEEQPSMTPRGSNPIERNGSFVRSLLYNQVPLTAFVNGRSVLALSSLFIQWILATYFFPFYAYIASPDLSVVAAHFTFVLGVATLCSIGSHEVC
jgi:hypothetical protein